MQLDSYNKSVGCVIMVNVKVRRRCR